MSEREQFEAWAKANPTLISAEFWTAKSIAKNAWEAAWQAARAQPAPITSESGNQAAQGASAITSAVPLLSEDELWDLWNAQGCDDMNQVEASAFARAIEQAVRTKMGAAR